MDVINYSITDAAIADMKKKYQGLVATTPKEYKEVTAAIAEVRTKRVAVEKMRKEYKKEALEYGRKVDSEAKRVTALLLEIEDPLKAAKKEVDDEKARKKQEEKEREEKRVAGIKGMIQELVDVLGKVSSMSAKKAQFFLDTFSLKDEQLYGEFIDEAREKYDKLKAALSHRVEEAEEAERVKAKLLAAEKELQAAREAAEKERAEKEAAERALEEQKKAEQRKKDEEELRKRLELEAKEKAAAELEAKAKAEEAAKVEAERIAAEKEAMRPDVEKAKDWLAESRKTAPTAENKQVDHIIYTVMGAMGDAEKALRELDD